MRRLSLMLILAVAAIIAIIGAEGAGRGVVAAPPRPTRPPPAAPTRAAAPSLTATPRSRPTLAATVAPLTPAPRPTLAATVAPVSDANAVLTACSQGIFGVHLTFTRSGGLTGQMARTLHLPEVVGAAIAANGTAVYGVTADRSVVAVVMGSGSASNADAVVQVNAASLCTVQMLRTQARPGDADAALATLLAAFPGAPQDAAYTPADATGGYAFSALTTRPIPSTGTLTAQGVVLAMTKASSSQALLSAVSGTGEFAGEVGE